MAQAPKKPNFEDILDAPSSEIQRPKQPPQGTYVAQIKGQYKEDKSAKKGTRYHEHIGQLVKVAVDKDGDPLDVDMEALQESLTKANGDVTALNEKSVRLTYYITPDALFMYKNFLTHLGIPTEDDEGNELSTRERADMATGRFLLIHIKHQPTADGEGVYVQVDKTAPYSEE